MNSAVRQFIEAHDRYMALQNARTEINRPEQREYLHVEILRAYLEVQMRAKLITGLQYADGNGFAEMN
ncbi:MAG: hypothetical protein NVS9B15_18320 [Acidobacteriaceae bacterium]